MRPMLELPRLSIVERDRRWTRVREQMRAQGLECLVLWGWPTMWDFCTANARYLCPIGGNAEFNVVVFPLTGEPTCFVQMETFLEGWRSAQQWVSDVRARQGSWADSVASRIAELGLDDSSIGVDGLANALDPDGWVPHDVYSRFLRLLPKASVVGIGDMMERIRAIKSQEEVELLEQAGRLGDMMMTRCKELARPGVRESEVYAGMLETMVANGGEEPTLFLWAAGPHPSPHPFRLPTTRKLAANDLIICEIHPKFAGYCTHIERTFSLGEPHPKQTEIFDGCVAAYERGMSMFGPGRSIVEAMDAVKAEMEDRGLDFCELGIHGHGLASLEYPRYRHHAIKSDRAAIKVIGDTFQEGMVFAFNIDLVDQRWLEGKSGCVFAETVHITQRGARRLHAFPKQMQISGRDF